MSITTRYENRKYDMQILLKLILMYNIYFRCVNYEILSLPKSCTAEVVAVNTPSYGHNKVSTIDLNEFKSNEKRYYLGLYSGSYHHSNQQLATNKPKVENKTSILQQYYLKNAIRNLHLSQSNTDMIYRRKLLSYKQIFSRTHPVKDSSRFYNVKHYDSSITARMSRLTKEKRNATKNIESKDKDTGNKNNVRKIVEGYGVIAFLLPLTVDSVSWGNWSIWTACSVTCGRGRQVRWRHCLSADCIKGLKKAQLRNCRLQDCSAKGFLGWLGIKS
ncbi:uncharacterized protein [Cardiocondyla obscurior]|uniref:uncharacterized protein n=1 Tax=Cardiocondyla obscurior TaxID=286306 RepID=UPI0039657FC2